LQTKENEAAKAAFWIPAFGSLHVVGYSCVPNLLYNFVAKFTKRIYPYVLIDSKGLAELAKKYPNYLALIRDLRDDERASMIVVDASVAMKWFLNDQDSSGAGLFHQSYKLVAPELIRIEVPCSDRLGSKYGIDTIMRRYR